MPDVIQKCISANDINNSNVVVKCGTSFLIKDRGGDDYIDLTSIENKLDNKFDDHRAYNGSIVGISSFPDDPATVDVQYTYNVDAVTSAPNVPITYSLIQYPDGMEIAENSGVITWTPTETGTEIIKVRATDARGSFFEQTFVLHII